MDKIYLEILILIQQNIQSDKTDELSHQILNITSFDNTKDKIPSQFSSRRLARRDSDDVFVFNDTVFIRLNAAAFITFFVIRVGRLFEGGIYLKSSLFLLIVTEHLNFKIFNRNMFYFLSEKSFSISFSISKCAY